jgi:hypothetical protein
VSTITAPFTGCVNLSDLTGDLIWTVTGPHKFEAGAWRGDMPGCDRTTHHQRPLEIEGGTDALDHLFDGQVLAIRWHWQTQDQCGRHQIDIHDVTAGEMVALVINSGTVCDGGGGVMLPPIVPPTLPPAAPIPEPATVLMVGGALLVARVRQIWSR